MLSVADRMSFNADAAKARDPERRYGARVRSLASCVENHCPFGFQATFFVLRKLAGPFRRDEAALLRAIDVLVESRERWLVHRASHARMRVEEKRRGRRIPTAPDPSTGPHFWYGPKKRAAEVHVLGYWWRNHPELRGLATSDEVGATLRALSTAFIKSDGPLSRTQLATVADCVWELSRRARSGRHEHRLLEVARLLSTSAIPG